MANKLDAQKRRERIQELTNELEEIDNKVEELRQKAEELRQEAEELEDRGFVVWTELKMLKKEHADEGRMR